MPKHKGGLGQPISFRLAPADREAYLEKVRASGLSQSDFFREVVLANRTKIVARPKASEDRKQMLRIFAKTSNNMNQIAHRANSEHVQGKLSEHTYEQMLYQLETIASYLRATLGHVD